MKIEFSATERKALDYERYHHPHPRVQRRMEVVWLYSQGKTPPEISQLASVSASTVYRYLRQYRTGGIAQLRTINFRQPQSELVAHTQSIEAEFQARPPASMKEAAHRIAELTGIKRSETQVSQFLQSIGLKRRKVGMIPAKADPERQAKFTEEQLDPVLDAAKAGKKSLFRRCCPFCACPLLGLSLVICTHFYSGTRWPTTL